MNIAKLQFDTTGVEITIFAPNGKYRRMQLGKILPMLDGRFYIQSEHFEKELFTYYKTIDQAKADAQKLFEQWVQNFYCA